MGLALLVISGAGLLAQTAPSPGDGFNPNANGIVNTTVLQPDGKILVGGYFTQFQPDNHPVSSVGYLARLNHDGSVDSSFTPVANGVVRPMVLQPNGQVLIGGQFTTIQPSGSSTPVIRNYVARLNSDGTLDSTFNPNANGVVYAIAYQPNGQVIIGGSFTTVQPAGSGVVTRNHIARFNTDGSLDTSFDPNTDRPVLAIAVQSTGQILIGGGFTTLTPNGATVATVRNALARVNADGTLDPMFDPEANGSVSDIIFLPDGRFLVGGQFTQMQPSGQLSATSVDFLARFSAAGVLDQAYIVDPLGSVSTMGLLQDGRLVIGGTFTRISGNNSTSTSLIPYLARINVDGTVDNGFQPNPNQAVNSLAIQPDGEVIVGGFFTTFVQGTASNPILRNFIARVEPNGTLDTTFAPNDQGAIFASVQLSNGQTLVGGSFLTIGGVTQSYLARLNADGSLDKTFTPTLNGPVQVITLGSNGQFYIGGHFTIVDGLQRNYICRMNANGTFDGPFNPNPDNTVTAIAVQTNGQVLIGGLFDLATPDGATASATTGSFFRANVDGTIDTTFQPAVSGGGVYGIALQSDGRIIIVGEFTQEGQTSEAYVARLNPTTGVLDSATFNPVANHSVYAVAVQSNGQVVIGGAFTTLVPQTGKAANTNTNTVTTLANGLSQTYPAPGNSANVAINVSNLARLNTDGSMDTTFLPDPSFTVLSLALQSNGSIVVGGGFTSFAPNGAVTGTIRNHIGRVTSTGTIDSAFNPNANGQVDSINVLSSGQVMIGGSFTALQPNGAASATPAVHFAILNSDGSLGTSFSAGANTAGTGQVNALAIEQTGQIIAAGSFSPFGGAPDPYMARFNPDGTSDTAFMPDLNGPVNAVAIEPSSALNTFTSNSVVWLTSAGAIRYTYTADANGQVQAIAQQADGQVYLGGLFSDFQGSSTLLNMVRIMTNGAVDPTFTPNINGEVTCIVVQPNGQLLVGGTFTGAGAAGSTTSTIAATSLVKGVSYVIESLGTTNFTSFGAANNTVGTVFVATGPGTGTGTVSLSVAATSYLIRLNTDGSIDTSFSPQPNGIVNCLALQSNGQVIAGGQFSAVEFNNSAGTARPDIARFNSDGTLDTVFNPVLNGQVNAIAITSSGQIVIAGAFNTIQPGGTGTVYDYQGLARLNSDGTVDTNFQPDPDSSVSAMVQLANGQLIVGGSFQTFLKNAEAVNAAVAASSSAPQPMPVTMPYLARINTDGSVDTSFYPDPNNMVQVIFLQPNGQLLVAGQFSAFAPNGIGPPVTRIFVARLNANGTVDTSFDPQFNAEINAIDELADGSIVFGGVFSQIQTGPLLLAGGSFSQVGGNPVSNLVRMNSDGTADSSFPSTTDGPVNAISFQQAGTVLVGGAFANVGGQPRANLAMLNKDGSLNAQFNPGANAAVNAFATQPNGQIVVGGAFTSIGGEAAQYLARLGPTGTPDASFLPAINGPIDSLVIQANGQIVIAGSFTTVAGLAVGNIARLNSNGTADATFNPNANGTVEALSLQADGTFIVTGLFTTIGGQSLPYAARLTSSGAVDTTFAPAPNGAVNAAAVQLDGKIVLGGGFTAAAGSTSRYDLVRIPVTNQVSQTIAASSDSSILSWTEGGGAPSLSGVTFEESSDSLNWTVVGQGSPVSQSTWQISGLGSPPSSPFFVRVTAIVPTARYSSSGLFQYVQEIYPGFSPVVDSISQTTGSSGTPFNFTVMATQASATFTAVGLPPGLTINGSTGVISGTPTASGSYQVFLTASSQGGTSTSSLVITIGATGSTSISTGSSAERLVNLSSRDQLVGSQTMIAGFVISGSTPETVLLRAVGPGLTQFNVAGVMATPELQLYSSAGTLMQQNSGWLGSPSLSSAFAQVGAFALSPTSADASIETTLSPGAYTLHVFDPTDAGGVVLTEIYDVNPSPLTDLNRLINISARGTVNPGAGALIGGFVVSGSVSENVLIRGVGPGLAQYGVTSPLADPVLRVFDASGNLVAENNAWGTQISAGADQGVVTAAGIASAASSVGAFALTPGSADTALIANLPPGSYTFEVTSASNSTGQALGEVYQLP